MAVSETPSWWFEKPGAKACLLFPFSMLYSRAAALAMHAKPAGSVPVPVLCIGNFVAGGGGKTPTALAIAQTIKARGFNPGFLSRGYGGKIAGPAAVDVKQHNALDVGDEPLLLARRFPTVVSADRLAGARLLVGMGVDFIVMDDGFQNPKLVRDHALVVVDARRGIGNGFAMPAGPLRVHMRDQLPLASSVLIIGDEDGADRAIRLAARSGKPVHHASIRMIDRQRWAGKSLLAYSGIADPQKFFDSLVDAGGQLSMVKSYPDHHLFSRDDVTELLDRAKLMEAQLVTTAKDYVRLLNNGEHLTRLARESLVARIDLEFEDETTANRIIDDTLRHFEERQLVETRLSKADKAPRKTAKGGAEVKEAV